MTLFDIISGLESKSLKELESKYKATQEEIKQLVTDSYTSSQTDWSANSWEFKLRNDKFELKLDKLKTELAGLLSTLLLYYLINSYLNGYYATAFELEGQVNISPISRNEIGDLLDKPFLDATFAQRIKDRLGEVVTKIRKAFVSSQVQEDTLKQAIYRIGEQINFNTLATIFTTELWRAVNLGINRLADENEIVMQWHTQLDKKVCAICSSLEGQIRKPKARYYSSYNKTYYESPAAHPVCRCLEFPKDLEDLNLGKAYTEFLNKNGYAENFK